MTDGELAATARALVGPDQVLLAADERPATVDRRLAVLGVEPGVDMRRAYREVLLATPDLAGAVSGVVVAEEVLGQATGGGIPFPQLLAERGLLWGVRADTAIARLAGCPGETMTEGLDGLGRRLTRAFGLGARFARWRAAFAVGDGRPSPTALAANAHDAGRFAALCQEQGLVPVVSARLLRAGCHSLERSYGATEAVLRAMVAELVVQGVDLSAVVLGPTMVLPGTAARTAGVDEVADATRLCLLRTVPDVVPGMAFSTTGQSAVAAAAHLAAVTARGPLPWPLILSSGPTLQESVLRAWCGRREEVAAAQQVLLHRLRCHRAAARGDWCPEMEAASPGRPVRPTSASAFVPRTSPAV